MNTLNKSPIVVFLAAATCISGCATGRLASGEATAARADSAPRCEISRHKEFPAIPTLQDRLVRKRKNGTDKVVGFLAPGNRSSTDPWPTVCNVPLADDLYDPEEPCGRTDDLAGHPELAVRKLGEDLYVGALVRNGRAVTFPLYPHNAGSHTHWLSSGDQPVNGRRYYVFFHLRKDTTGKPLKYYVVEVFDPADHDCEINRPDLAPVCSSNPSHSACTSMRARSATSVTATLQGSAGGGYEPPEE